MSLKENKSRVLVGAAVGALSFSLTGIGATESRAQGAASQPLPPVSIDAPQQRARVTSTARSRAVSQRSARVAPRQANERPPAPVVPATTMGTTRTIGNPAPAYAGGQVAQGGTLGLLGSTNVMNVPFSTVNYTSQLIENQQARTAADTLINDASVRLATGANGYDDTFLVRGFPVDGKDIGLNGLYGLVSTYHVPAPIIERIELLKGPGALINGISPANSIGGGINIVTKRAAAVDFNRITPSYISSANFGAHLEMSKRYGANREWGLRFNGVARDGEASIRDGNARSGLGALSLDYAGERFRWTVDAITQNDDAKNFRPQISIRATNPFVPVAPDARGNWFPDTKLKQRDNTIATGIEYDVTNWLTAYAGVGARDEKHEQNLASTTAGVDQFGNINAFNAYYDQYIKTVTGNAGVRAKLDIGFVTHKLNVAVTGYNQELGYAYVTSALPANPSTPVNVASNIYNPSPLPPIIMPRLEPQRSSEIRNSSVAFSDTMSILDETFMLTLGARYQTVATDTYNITTGALTPPRYGSVATTPLAGVVFKPLKNVSLYANYAEGLSQGIVVGLSFNNRNEVLPPYISKQKEAGVKVDWGTIITTAAVFDISRPNLITVNNFRLLDGEQSNHGLELNAYGLLLPGLRGMASYTYLIPEITKALLPADIGKDASGVPRTRVSAGLDWDTPWVSGFSLNGRVIYTGHSYLTTANTVEFPSWTRYDIGARYTTTALTGKPVTFRANIENIFNKNYWVTTGTFASVGSPRTYVLSAAFDF